MRKDIITGFVQNMYLINMTTSTHGKKDSESKGIIG